MEQVGQQIQIVEYCKISVSWKWNFIRRNAALALGGNAPTKTTATEEWTGAGAPLTQTITTS
jgi:hypothetical protein